MNKIVPIVLIFISVCFFSCSKEAEYSFQVRNDTNYKIEELIIHFGDNNKETISVEPKKSSDVYTLTYKTSGANFFSPGSLGVYVSKYSDSISTYQNSIGISIKRDKLSGGLNILVLSLEQPKDNDTNPFTWRLE